MAMTNGSWRQRLGWLVRQPKGTIWEGKDYEYTYKKVNDHFEIFRRHTEMDKWLLYTRLVIVDGIIFANSEGVKENCEKYYKQCRDSYR